MEVAVDLLRAVVLNLDTRGNRRALWRSRAGLSGQQRSSFGGGDLCSEVRGPQGGHRREGAGGGSGGGGGAAAGVSLGV